MLILNEEKYAQDLYCGKHPDVKSTIVKVGYITRYLLHSLKYDDKDNYMHTVEWMQTNHNNFDESTYSNLISDAIKRAHKMPFYKIDNIKITQYELDIIATLEDLRAEKVLFVLLCLAKQQAVSYGFEDGLVKYSLSDVCKMARISIPTEDREYILYNIIQTGLLGYPKKNNTKCLFVKFIDHEGESVLHLSEDHCTELAYEYLNWKNNSVGYDRCELCGKVIKQSKRNPKRFCKECAGVVGNVPNDVKVIKCVDCGELVYIPVLNTKTCRCEPCQENYRRKYMKSLMQEKRVSAASKIDTVQN
jgi:hypothetical protein